MIDRFTKVCLTVIAVSLAVIGLRGLPMIGPAHADLDDGLEKVGSYQVATLSNTSFVILDTQTSFFKVCKKEITQWGKGDPEIPAGCTNQIKANWKR